METEHDQMPRVGAVSYLNSKPLIEGLAEELPLTLDYPSSLADDLSAGRLDVALVPSIEYFRHPGYEILSDACVATRGNVLSVKLFCRVHPGEITRLALDAGSRTSSTLVRIILAEQYGAFPQLQPLPLDCDTADTDADAILLIGDRAMLPRDESFVETWDLGTKWREWTGLPFVFAMWVAGPGAEVAGLPAMLSAARDRGVAAIDEIAAREAPLTGIDAAAARDYLKNNLHFHLGPAELSGLRLFHRYASQLGLIPKGRTVVDHVTA